MGETVGFDDVYFERDELESLLAAAESPSVERVPLDAANRRGWVVRRALLAADLTGLLAAFVVADVLTGSVAGDLRVGDAGQFAVFLATLPAWIVLAKVYGLYDRDEERASHSTVDDIVPVFHFVLVGVWAFIGLAWALHRPLALEELVVFWLTAVLAISGGRALARAICRRSVAYCQNALIVGSDELGQLLARKLLRHPEYGINLVGFVDSDRRELPPDLDDIPHVSSLEDLPIMVEMLNVERVILAQPAVDDESAIDMIRALRHRDVQVDITPRLYEILGHRVGIHSIEGLPLMGLPRLRLSRSSLALKRALDLTVASVALLFLLPLLGLIALAILVSDGGPVLFRQARMGAGGKPFMIYKFRTMVVDADDQKQRFAHLNQHAKPGGDARMFKIPDDPRTTRTGRLLRRYSLDELPQLLNVLRGEMSLVGPRPLVLDEDRHVRAWARRRLDLKPGITGLWQVLGRNDIPFEDMVKLDYLYVTDWSFAGDLKLVLRTLSVLASRRGV